MTETRPEQEGVNPEDSPQIPKEEKPRAVNGEENAPKEGDIPEPFKIEMGNEEMRKLFDSGATNEEVRKFSANVADKTKNAGKEYMVSIFKGFPHNIEDHTV